MPTGKLEPDLLREWVGRCGTDDPRVLMGPGIGEDAAALDTGDSVLIVTTDPITFATDEIGYYSVMVNANDVAATGADPAWFTVTMLLPEKPGNRELADTLFDQIHEACRALGIAVIGGHTEITHGLDRPILVGQMMGLAKKEDLVPTAGARPGDWLLLTKGISVEGTALMAREKREHLISRGVSRSLLDRAAGFLHDPGISVVEEARLARFAARPRAMHDITEGGLANGLNEMAEAAGVQVEVERDRVPIYEECRILCSALGLDPLGLIGSGSLLISAPPEEARKVLDKAEEKGLPVTHIGRIKPEADPRVVMVQGDVREPVPVFKRDEIAKLF
jgi:hydrogenase maturation factor